MDRLDFLPSKEEFQRLSFHFRVPVAVSLWIPLGKGGLLNLLKPEVPCWVLSECLREDGPYEPISYLIEAKDPYFFQKGFEINKDSLSSWGELLKPMPSVNGLPKFQGGAWGLFSYDISEALEPYLSGKIKRSDLPGLILFKASEFLAYSPKESKLFLKKEALDPTLDPNKSSLVPLTPKAEFMASVNEFKDSIVSGECIQVVLSQRFLITEPKDPIEAYSLLRARNPSPYSCLMKCRDFYLIASSPEMLFRVQGDELILRPIAGTIQRPGTFEADRIATRALLGDPKEMAEHIMLLDLGRNDVIRIAIPGSVKVIQRAM
ncbi:MAG: chorismate-binding protein, partial [Desulfatiglandales bacterium]